MELRSGSRYIPQLELHYSYHFNRNSTPRPRKKTKANDIINQSRSQFTSSRQKTNKTSAHSAARHFESAGALLGGSSETSNEDVQSDESLILIEEKQSYFQREKSGTSVINLMKIENQNHRKMTRRSMEISSQKNNIFTSYETYAEDKTIHSYKTLNGSSKVKQKYYSIKTSTPILERVSTNNTHGGFDDVETSSPLKTVTSENYRHSEKLLNSPTQHYMRSKQEGFLKTPWRIIFSMTLLSKRLIIMKKEICPTIFQTLATKIVIVIVFIFCIN